MLGGVSDGNARTFVDFAALVDAMVAAYALPASPDPATVYTDAFLPPVAERMPPKSGE
jgi:hypothetical protein